MEKIINFIYNNCQWIFSGIGVFLISAISAFLLKRRSGKNLSQKIKNNSFGMQAGENITISVHQLKSTSNNGELYYNETDNQK